MNLPNDKLTGRHLENVQMARQMTELENYAAGDGYDLNELKRLSTLSVMWAYEAKRLLRNCQLVILSASHRTDGDLVSDFLQRSTKYAEKAIDELITKIAIPNC